MGGGDVNTGIRSSYLPARAAPKAAFALARYVPVASGIAAALLMFVRLFVPHPVGMANNGDAVRLLCQLGVDPDAPPKPSAKWYFARFSYPFAGSRPPCADYPSTQIPLLRATAWAHQHVLGLSGAVDLRELAVEYCVLVGLVLAVFTHATRSIRPLARTLLVCGLFLLLSEALFADYAASPYMESAALNGVLVFALAGALLVGGSRYRRLAYLIAWGAAVLAVGAKNEMITLALPFALFLGTRRFPLGPRHRTGPAISSEPGESGASDGSGRWSHEAGGSAAPAWWLRRGVDRIVPALCVLSLAATAGWNLHSERLQDAQVNFGNEVTMTIMPLTSDPAQVAVGLGLPASFGRYSGSSWWSLHPIEKDPRYPRYADKFTDANLGRYLSGHPVLAAKVFASGAGAYYTFRAGYLGSYAMSAGYGSWAQECRVCLIQNVSHSLSWAGIGGVLAYWLACAAAALLLVRRSLPGSRRRGFALVALTLIGCTLVQYITSVFGEGNEVTKHLSVALFAACLAPLWLAAAALNDRRRRTAAAHVPSARTARIAARARDTQRSETSA